MTQRQNLPLCGRALGGLQTQRLRLQRRGARTQWRNPPLRGGGPGGLVPGAERVAGTEEPQR